MILTWFLSGDSSMLMPILLQKNSFQLKAILLSNCGTNQDVNQALGKFSFIN